MLETPGQLLQGSELESTSGPTFSTVRLYKNSDLRQTAVLRSDKNLSQIMTHDRGQKTSVHIHVLPHCHEHCGLQAFHISISKLGHLIFENWRIGCKSFVTTGVPCAELSMLMRFVMCAYETTKKRGLLSVGTLVLGTHNMLIIR